MRTPSARIRDRDGPDTEVTANRERLVLAPAAAEALEGGRRDLELRLAATGTRLDPRRPLFLYDAAGRALGLAIADPENDRLRVMCGPGEPFDELDSSLYGARVEAALARRRALGLVADVYGGWAVLHAYGRALVRPARDLAPALIGGAELRGVVLKLRGRGAAARGEVLQEVHGEPPPERIVVSEGALRYEVHLLAGINVGLFTDMREQRTALAREAAACSVLNGFSYTGTLSVAVAKAGASAVASVDLSAGVQGWARDNFRLNGLDPRDARYRFEVADVGRYLADAAAGGHRYDLVLLDPPAFSAARGAGFAIDRDYPPLIAAACATLPAGGRLWLACNARTSRLVNLAGTGFERAGRSATLLAASGLPADHPTLSAQPEDAYLQVALYRLA
jgi:23S rRNA (cytosine1962-C5)-methyltransferase